MGTNSFNNWVLERNSIACFFSYSFPLSSIPFSMVDHMVSIRVPSMGMIGDLVWNGRILASNLTSTADLMAAEQEITEQDIRMIESEQEITEMDLKIMELETKINIPMCKAPPLGFKNVICCVSGII